MKGRREEASAQGWSWRYRWKLLVLHETCVRGRRREAPAGVSCLRPPALTSSVRPLRNPGSGAHQWPPPRPAPGPGFQTHICPSREAFGENATFQAAAEEAKDELGVSFFVFGFFCQKIRKCLKNDRNVSKGHRHQFEGVPPARSGTNLATKYGTIVMGYDP